MSNKNKKKRARSEKEKIKGNRPSKKVNNPSLLPSFWTNYPHLLSVFSALIITFACFFNTTNNQFVNWDDDRNFYENEHVTTINKDNFWSNSKKILLAM